jgi:hypothetical protein
MFGGLTPRTDGIKAWRNGSAARLFRCRALGHGASLRWARGQPLSLPEEATDARRFLPTEGAPSVPIRPQRASRSVSLAISMANVKSVFFITTGLQPAGHAVAHGNADAGLAVSRVLLVVLTQPPVPPQPAEGSLHDPALGQMDVTAAADRPQHGGDQPAETLPGPFNQGRVGPVNLGDRQPRQARSAGCEQQAGAVAPSTATPRTPPGGAVGPILI